MGAIKVIGWMLVAVVVNIGSCCCSACVIGMRNIIGLDQRAGDTKGTTGDRYHRWQVPQVTGTTGDRYHMWQVP